MISVDLGRKAQNKQTNYEVCPAKVVKDCYNWFKPILFKLFCTW